MADASDKTTAPGSWITDTFQPLPAEEARQLADALGRPQTTPLTVAEKKAMQELKRLLASGERIGTKRIVSMQGCEKAGLVKRVVGRNGMIADWMLTDAGKVWNA